MGPPWESGESTRLIVGRGGNFLWAVGKGIKGTLLPSRNPKKGVGTLLAGFSNSVSSLKVT